MFSQRNNLQKLIAFHRARNNHLVASSLRQKGRNRYLEKMKGYRSSTYRRPVVCFLLSKLERRYQH